VLQRVLRIKFRVNGEPREKYLLDIVSRLMRILPPSARKKLEDAVWKIDNENLVLECMFPLSVPLRIASFWRALFDGACKNIDGYITCEVEEVQGLEPFLGITTRNFIIKNETAR